MGLKEKNSYITFKTHRNAIDKLHLKSILLHHVPKHSLPRASPDSSISTVRSQARQDTTPYLASSSPRSASCPLPCSSVWPAFLFQVACFLRIGVLGSIRKHVNTRYLERNRYLINICLLSQWIFILCGWLPSLQTFQVAMETQRPASGFAAVVS